MPFPQEKTLTFANNSLDTAQFQSADTMAARQPDRCQPELALTLSCVHMDMRRLASFV